MAPCPALKTSIPKLARHFLCARRAAAFQPVFSRGARFGRRTPRTSAPAKFPHPGPRPENSQCKVRDTEVHIQIFPMQAASCRSGLYLGQSPARCAGKALNESRRKHQLAAVGEINDDAIDASVIARQGGTGFGEGFFCAFIRGAAILARQLIPDPRFHRVSPPICFATAIHVHPPTGVQWPGRIASCPR